KVVTTITEYASPSGFDLILLVTDTAITVSSSSTFWNALACSSSTCVGSRGGGHVVMVMDHGES
ncbi:hypothetical protein PIB30_021125, partial [Stylosanthes scabra]|nr:hypothetical protein [Stylosanthes scabra]